MMASEWRGRVEELYRFVRAHMARGRFSAAELERRGHVNTLDRGRHLDVVRKGDYLVIGGAGWVIGEDVVTENGVIHVINRVLDWQT